MNPFLLALGLGGQPSPPPAGPVASLRGAPIPYTGDSDASAPWIVGAPAASSPASDLIRLWPPAFGGQPGQSIGWLQAAPRAPETSVEVVCPATCYTLTLDPEWTAPNARVGIAWGSAGARRRSTDAVLRPGQTLVRPSGFTRFWLYVADGLENVGVANRNFGFCSFLAGLAPDARMSFTSRPFPSAPAALIHGGQLITWPGPGLYVHPSDMAALRVFAFGVNNAGAVQAAQWSAELLISVQSSGGTNPAPGPDLSVTPDTFAVSSFAAAQPPVRVGIGPQMPENATPVWGDAVTVPIPTGAAMLTLSLSSAFLVPAGSPITRIWALVEGLPPGSILPPPARRMVVLYDVTSGAAAALDTGAIPTADFDTLYVDALASAGTMQLSPFEVSDAGINRAVATPPAAAIAQQGAWGPGSAVPTGFAATAWAVPYPVPRRVRFTTGAAAAGNVRLRVIGTRSGFGR